MKLVMVEWKDAMSACAIWTERDNEDELKVLTVTAVGILYKETEDTISVILTINPLHYSQSITIPRGCIKRIRYLKVK